MNHNQGDVQEGLTIEIYAAALFALLGLVECRDVYYPLKRTSGVCRNKC